MNDIQSSSLLSPTEGPAARTLNGNRASGIVLVCEHASRFIPSALENLGLDAAASMSHAAWDIGAMELSVELSAALDATLVFSRISRLVYDCNRPPSAKDAIPPLSEIYSVPGNAELSDSERALRVKDVYEPFCSKLSDTLDNQTFPPVIITIHSFTPVYNGKLRAVELGILHDSDDRAACALLAAAEGSGLNVALNEPYSATDGVTHTLRKHGISRGLHNVMIEVRNNLIDTPEGVNRMVGLLTPMLKDMMAHLSQSEAAQ